MMHMEDESDIAFDDLVQQQFLLCKEKTSRKFIQLEELIELAEQKLSLLMSIQVKETEERFANAFGWKAKVRRDSVGQHPGVITDSSCHLELRLPKLEEAEVSECLQDKEHQLADFSIGYKTQEWSNPAEEENAYAAYTGEPIYDEEQGEGQECWPEQEFILAALNKDNLYAPNPLQSEISKSERSEELEDFQEHPRYDEVPGENKKDWHSEEIICIALGLEDFFEPKKNLKEGNSNERSEEWADFSNIQDLQHKNVPPSDISTDPYNVVQPSREEKYVKISVVDPYIFQSIGSSTTNCMMAPRNSLTWSTEDLDMPSVGNNNSDAKFELNGHSLFFNGKGIYNGLDKKFSNFGKKNVMIIFDPGGDEPAGVFKVVKELFKQDVKRDEGVSVISTSDLLGLQDMIWLKFLTIEQLTKEHSELRKEVCKVQMLTSFGIQVVGDETDGVISDRVISEINQQYAQSIRAGMKMITTYFVMRYGFHEMDVVMGLEDLKASRRCEVIYIFDPGGKLSCLHGVLLDVITGILHFQQFLHDLLKGKDLFIT